LEMESKQDSLGIRDLRKALELDTTQVDLYGEIAKSLYTSGKYVEAADAYHKFGESSRQAKLADHFREGLGYYFGFDDQSTRAEKDKTVKPDSALLTKADSAFSYVIKKTAPNPFADAVLYRAYINDRKEADRNNIKGFAKPFYEQYIQLITAKGAPDDKTKPKLANAYVYLGIYAEYKDKDEAKALDYFNKAKEMDPTNAQVVYYFAKKAQGKSK
jgi:tetratricopeptide (TPR) repeat protein